MMPVSLALVRHGQSESNLAKDMFEQNKTLSAEEALMAVHTSERRLTDLGKQQAQAAGAWLRENWFDPDCESDYRFYVSPYVRAMETAGHIGIGSDWKPDSRLMERNWGDFDQKPYAERALLFEQELKYRKEHAFFWRPTNGETLQDVFLRLRDMLATLHRECHSKKVLMVSHGETMWVWRDVLERWMPQQLREAMLAHSEQTRIRNCRIIEYTRETESGELAARFIRMRFVNPEDPNDPDTNLGWHPIPRKNWSSQDLLDFVDGYQRFIPITEAA